MQKKNRNKVNVRVWAMRVIIVLICAIMVITSVLPYLGGV